MELTYGDVVRAVPALGELLRLKPAPTVGIAVKIARNVRKLQAVADDFDTARSAVVKTLRAQFTETWTNDEGEEQTGIPAMRQAEFEAAATAEVTELAEGIVTVDVREVSEADLLHCEQKRKNFEIPASILFDLWFMFDLEAPDPEQPPMAEAA